MIKREFAGFFGVVLLLSLAAAGTAWLHARRVMRAAELNRLQREYQKLRDEEMSLMARVNGNRSPEALHRNLESLKLELTPATGAHFVSAPTADASATPPSR